MVVQEPVRMPCHSQKGSSLSCSICRAASDNRIFILFPHLMVSKNSLGVTPVYFLNSWLK